MSRDFCAIHHREWERKTASKLQEHFIARFQRQVNLGIIEVERDIIHISYQILSHHALLQLSEDNHLSSLSKFHNITLLIGR